jgi:hypothetical protein
VSSSARCDLHRRRGWTHAPVGVALNLMPTVPASDEPLDRAAALRLDGYVNRVTLGVTPKWYFWWYSARVEYHLVAGGGRGF